MSQLVAHGVTPCTYISGFPPHSLRVLLPFICSLIKLQYTVDADHVMAFVSQISLHSLCGLQSSGNWPLRS